MPLEVILALITWQVAAEAMALAGVPVGTAAGAPVATAGIAGNAVPHWVASTTLQVQVGCLAAPTRPTPAVAKAGR